MFASAIALSAITSPSSIKYHSPKIQSFSNPFSLSSSPLLTTENIISLRGSSPNPPPKPVPKPPPAPVFIERNQFSDSSCQNSDGSAPEGYRIGACLPNVNGDGVITGSFKFYLDTDGVTPYYQSFSDYVCATPNGAAISFVPALSCNSDGGTYNQWKFISNADLSQDYGLINA